MIRLVLVFIGFFSISVSSFAQTDPFVLQMQINATQNNINALNAENASLKLELEALEAKSKKKKLGANLAIGAGVLGGAFGGYGIYKAVKATGELKETEGKIKSANDEMNKSISEDPDGSE